MNEDTYISREGLPRLSIAHMQKLKHLNKMVMAKKSVQTPFLYLQTFLSGPIEVMLVTFRSLTLKQL